MKSSVTRQGGVKMREKDAMEEEVIDLEEDQEFYLNEEELLEDDEISDIEEAFIKGYSHA